MEKDPVCAMEVDPRTSRLKSEHRGRTYYFCGPGCRKAFEANPDRFLAPGYKPSMGAQ